MPDEAPSNSSRLSKLPALFIATFSISLTANSGYAILAVMRDDLVRKRAWIAEGEMADYIAIAQSSPGPMAVTASTVVGYHVAGLAGSLAAVAGVILPPFLAMVAVTVFYHALVDNPYVSLFLRGMQMGVVAMLFDVIIGLFRSATEKRGAYPFIVMVLAFLYVRLTGCSIVWLVLICAVSGAAKAMLARQEEKR